MSKLMRRRLSLGFNPMHWPVGAAMILACSLVWNVALMIRVWVLP